jgi:hypothetical protein
MAHQEGLRVLIARLQGGEQDVALLTQLAESLPRLRAGLGAAERQRIDELDANHSALTRALDGAHEAIDVFDAILAPDRTGGPPPLLIDGALLRRVSEAARALAEASNELALRASVRAGLLE